ncbi:hypothetical protein ACOZ06_002173 [Cronobacter muytjensii]|nr:hypothetical protein [Cronobacter muytjensii]ELY3984512.1 hypothetical protein [Cronobacter muytjensii]ELY6225539.1 hypothetical protein [Cronobacter muytjensii]ELY6275649.1 hypothetical protein [Cronobacter muytjensii]MEB8640668.1 hypothetical protein [Cronobacter muytjensii]
MTQSLTVFKVCPPVKGDTVGLVKRACDLPLRTLHKEKGSAQWMNN